MKTKALISFAEADLRLCFCIYMQKAVFSHDEAHMICGCSIRSLQEDFNRKIMKLFPKLAPSTHLKGKNTGGL